MSRCQANRGQLAVRAAAILLTAALVQPAARGASEPAPGPRAGAPAPFSIEATLVGGPELNPNLQGHASPVVVRVFELTRTTAFQAASFTSLFERAPETLGDELLGQDEFVLRPGEIRHYDHDAKPGATALGLVAAFRTLDNEAWRIAVPLAPGAHNLLLIDFNNNRIRVPSLPGETAGH